jgi:toxin ParE1/3/4
VKPIVYLPRARDDLRQIVRYYERQRGDLGKDFRDAVKAAGQVIRRTPQAFAYDDTTETRKYVMRRFPYLIHFVEKDTEVTVVAIAHQRRRPGFWVEG